MHHIAMRSARIAGPALRVKERTLLKTLLQISCNYIALPFSLPHNFMSDLSGYLDTLFRKANQWSWGRTTLDTETYWPEVLRSFRQRNNLKQEAAASLLGVSQAYVSKVENGAVQPSAALLKRLVTLSKQPDHRPTLDLFKATVRHSLGLTFLMSHHGGKTHILESSRSFHNAGEPFISIARSGALTLDWMDKMCADTMFAITAAGAFDGRFGYIEAVWKTRDGLLPKKRHFRTVFMPLRTDEDEWLLQGSVAEIDSDACEAAVAAWGGCVRFFKHDEEPPYEWP